MGLCLLMFQSLFWDWGIGTGGNLGLSDGDGPRTHLTCDPCLLWNILSAPLSPFLHFYLTIHFNDLQQGPIEREQQRCCHIWKSNKKCGSSWQPVAPLGLITIQFANVCNRFLGEVRRKSAGEIIFCGDKYLLLRDLPSSWSSSYS